MTQELINFMLKNAVGKANAKKQYDLALVAGSSIRDLQKTFESLNNKLDFPYIIGGNTQGNYICTEDDIDRTLKKDFRDALTRLATARRKAYKAKLHNQSKINVESLELEIIESLKVAE